MFKPAHLIWSDWSSWSRPGPAWWCSADIFRFRIACSCCRICCRNRGNDASARRRRIARDTLCMPRQCHPWPNGRPAPYQDCLCISNFEPGLSNRQHKLCGCLLILKWPWQALALDSPLLVLVYFLISIDVAIWNLDCAIINNSNVLSRVKINCVFTWFKIIPILTAFCGMSCFYKNKIVF